jgi:hypothetical protein
VPPRRAMRTSSRNPITALFINICAANYQIYGHSEFRNDCIRHIVLEHPHFLRFREVESVYEDDISHLAKCSVKFVYFYLPGQRDFP